MKEKREDGFGRYTVQSSTARLYCSVIGTRQEALAVLRRYAVAHRVSLELHQDRQRVATAWFGTGVPTQIEEVAR